METLNFEPGDYRFVKGVFQYSAGIAPLPGHRLVRVMFRDCLLYTSDAADEL